MEKLFDTLYTITFNIFTILYIVMFFVSIKKCFLREKKNRVKLFFLTFVTNPIMVFIVTFVTAMISCGLIWALISGNTMSQGINEAIYGDTFSLQITMVGGMMFIALSILFSHLIGRWLKAPNVSMVTFIYLMFSVIYGLSGSSSDDSSSAVPIPTSGFNLMSNICSIAAICLLYRYVIRPLSALTDKERAINWKLFLIPPILFLPIYYTFDYCTFTFGSYAANLVSQLFSLLVVFLFIWAFCVIIRNINATNAAIEAKDLAAEMARAEARIEADLSIAKSIQTSALPRMFPPFPDKTEFELFASMNAAKEVGGDFYDFYLLNDSTLGFLIADVSGKSIPGAMFMMTAKTVIKSLAESGLSPAQVFTQANNKLCEGNEAEMFVTAWLGYLDLKTGLVNAANAGHNPPVLIHNGKAEYLKLRPGFVLAGMEGIKYKEQEIRLEKGDMLYLYTDGVTEAMNNSEDLYGEERLKELLSFGDEVPEPSEKNGIAEPVCEKVLDDVSEFTDGAEQSDDITMLCVRYMGEKQDQ